MWILGTTELVRVEDVTSFTVVSEKVLAALRNGETLVIYNAISYPAAKQFLCWLGSLIVSGRSLIVTDGFTPQVTP